MALTQTTKPEKHTSSCPWGNVAKSTPTPCSFSSLMDEEYAKQIEEEEEVRLGAIEQGDKSDVHLINEGKDDDIKTT